MRRQHQLGRDGPPPAACIGQGIEAIRVDHGRLAQLVHEVLRPAQRGRLTPQSRTDHRGLVVHRLAGEPSPPDRSNQAGGLLLQQQHRQLRYLADQPHAYGLRCRDAHQARTHARGAQPREKRRTRILERASDHQHSTERSFVRAGAALRQVALHPRTRDARHRHGVSPARGAPSGRSAIAIATAMRRSCEIETVTSPNPMASARAAARP